MHGICKDESLQAGFSILGMNGGKDRILRPVLITFQANTTNPRATGDSYVFWIVNSPVRIKKLCDGFDITLVEFFGTDNFNLLEQEIK